MAEVKISQLLLFTPELEDQIIVNDVSAVVTKRATLQDIRDLANKNIDDTLEGSQVTGDLTVTGSIQFGTEIVDPLGNSITDLSLLITEGELTNLLESLLGVSEEGGIASLRCLRDSAPTRSGYDCGVRVLGETTFDSDVYLTTGNLYIEQGVGYGVYEYALAADSADHTRYALHARTAKYADSAGIADSADRSAFSLLSKCTQEVTYKNADGTDLTFYPLFVENPGPACDSAFMDIDLRFNALDNIFGGPTISFEGDGSLLTGVVAESKLLQTSLTNLDAEHYITFRLDPTGADSTHTDASLKFNPVTTTIAGQDSSDLYLWGTALAAQKIESKAATGLNYIIMKGSIGRDSAAVSSGLSFDATSETLAATNFTGNGSGLTFVDANTSLSTKVVSVAPTSLSSTHYMYFGPSASGLDSVNVNPLLQIKPGTQTFNMASDTARFTLGEDSDLKVYHDGSNAYIDTITGSLTITNSVSTNVVILTGLPTSDPINAGQLWNDNGTLKISAG